MLSQNLTTKFFPSAFEMIRTGCSCSNCLLKHCTGRSEITRTNLLVGMGASLVLGCLLALGPDGVLEAISPGSSSRHPRRSSSSGGVGLGLLNGGGGFCVSLASLSLLTVFSLAVGLAFARPWKKLRELQETSASSSASIVGACRYTKNALLSAAAAAATPRAAAAASFAAGLSSLAAEAIYRWAWSPSSPLAPPWQLLISMPSWLTAAGTAALAAPVAGLFLFSGTGRRTTPRTNKAVQGSGS